MPALSNSRDQEGASHRASRLDETTQGRPQAGFRQTRKLTPMLFSHSIQSIQPTNRLQAQAPGPLFAEGPAFAVLRRITLIHLGYVSHFLPDSTGHNDPP
jgi:hypothetical protein